MDKVEYQRLYRENHREKAKQTSREWRANNRERSRETVRRYQALHQEETKQRASRRKEKQKQLKLKILTYYGNGRCSCVQCGESRIDCLSIDHLNNDGYQHRKKVGNGVHFYLWLERNNYPLGYQTLCMNCQFIKRADLWR